jgi:hypothetical protein
VIAETISWIPVADKLPDADTTVLICAPASDEPIWTGFYDGVYWFAVGGEMYGNDDELSEQVTHWASFPRGPT